MHVSLIITILGADRPGLVSSVSEVLEAYKGSWSESRMTHLAGKFAGILQISVPEANIEALTIALNELKTDDLKILIETTKIVP